MDDSAGTGRAISNDVNSIAVAMPSAVQDISGVNVTGMERLLLRADLTVTLNGTFNDAATTGIHTVLSNFRTLAASQVGRTTVIVVSGDTLTEEILYTDYQMNFGADGALTLTIPGSMSDGTLGGWA